MPREQKNAPETETPENKTPDTQIENENKPSGEAPSGNMPENQTAPTENAAAPEPSPAAAENPAEDNPPVIYAGAEEIPPLSQSEREHLTYLRVLEEYNIARDRRQRYKSIGVWFIIISGIIFLTLIFSLEAKILFLCLWIITILCCVAMMIRADYKYDTFKEYLGFADELDFIEKEEEEED